MNKIILILINLILFISICTNSSEVINPISIIKSNDIEVLINPISSLSDSKCDWKKRDDAPEVYYINMDSSKNRKLSMELHLNSVGLRYKRVRGLTPQEIYIPDDIEKTWTNRWCMLQTESNIPNKNTITVSSPFYNYTHIMAAMCGRGKGRNTPKELGCTTSHLVAMREAIYSTTATSRYALIVEDDVLFPFDVDYNELAMTAPEGFGILQLFNSNGPSMRAGWELYKKKNTLWMDRNIGAFNFWSTCAYLIDRVVMKDIIDKVIFEREGWMQFKVIAGITTPCVPAKCCPKEGDQFIATPPCVWAPRGYQADSFLYAMKTTYMITVPLICNGLGSNGSTFHQSHVEMFHRKAFRQQRGFINEMLDKTVKPPSFAKPACLPLDIDAM